MTSVLCRVSSSLNPTDNDANCIRIYRYQSADWVLQRLYNLRNLLHLLNGRKNIPSMHYPISFPYWTWIAKAPSLLPSAGSRDVCV